MMATTATGFLVVRLPDFAMGFAHPLTPKLGARSYCGLDRLPWEDLSIEQTSSTAALLQLTRSINKIKKLTTDVIGIPFLRSEELALEILAMVGEEKNEVIAIAVEDNKFSPLPLDPSRWEGIGYDGFSVGEWSVIREGIFVSSQYFRKFEADLNDFGLFESISSLQCYCQAYIDLQSQNIVEPIRMDRPVQRVNIFRRRQLTDQKF